ncbi:MAG: hypothetical protein LBS07_01550 [Prevotellaceae bacterium]|jgi:hypothetical protein|nr:hypothetical protein [Prevotellaceae bacterium]
MEVITLEGEDKRLYYLVAHLVIDEQVLAYNLNYPYKTSPDYRWFVAVEQGKTVGFVPVRLKEGKAIINNYYVADDDSAVFLALLQEIVRNLEDDFEIESVTQVRHIPDFQKNGFSVLLWWKKYVKMKRFRHEEERL